jgi:hypothetical protein
VLAVLYWIPESPRYYVDRDQPEKALRILAKYHANGNEQDEVVQLEFAEITNAIAMDKVANTNYSYLDFFRTPGNRHRFIIIISYGVFSQWSGNGLLSYYLVPVLKTIGIESSVQQLGINGGLSTYNLGFGIIFSFVIDMLGRRFICLWSTIGRLATFTILTIISARYAAEPSTSLGNGVVVMIFLYYLAYAFPYVTQSTLLYVYDLTFKSDLALYPAMLPKYSLMDFAQRDIQQCILHYT